MRRAQALERSGLVPREFRIQREFFAPFSKIVLIGVQVYYDEAQLAAAADGNADAVRAQSYEPAKRSLLEALFQLERRFKGAVAIAAGRCEQCQTCTRVQGKPCCKPARMRYSFSAFQMDLMGIAEQQLGMPLIWSKEALPPYQVAIGALLHAIVSLTPRCYVLINFSSGMVSSPCRSFGATKEHPVWVLFCCQLDFENR